MELSVIRSFKVLKIKRQMADGTKEFSIPYRKIFIDFPVRLERYCLNNFGPGYNLQVTEDRVEKEIFLDD